MFTIRSLPNLLGLFRIAATPVLMGLILLDSAAGYFWAAGLFTLMAVSDFVDGRLARHLKVVSPLGVFIDTISDKVCTAGILLPLVQNGLISSWIALIIIGREFIISGLRSYAASQGVVIAAGVWGKQKFAITVVAIVWLLLAVGAEALGVAVRWDGGPLGLLLALWVVPMAMAVIWTVLSAVDYLVKAWPMLRSGWSPLPTRSAEAGTDTTASTS